MGQIFSTPLDQSVIQLITELSQTLGVSKRVIVENAILQYAEDIDHKKTIDVFEQTSGAWQREETPGDLTKQSSEIFRRSMKKYQR